jgi:hypothetical protein
MQQYPCGCVLCTPRTEGFEIPTWQRGQALSTPLVTEDWYTSCIVEKSGKHLVGVHMSRLLSVCLKQVLDLAKQYLQLRASKLVR